MGNQKYIISFLLIIIVVLLGFTTYLLFQRPANEPQTTTQKTETTRPAQKITYPTPENVTIPEITERAPTQPDVYLGSNVSIPKDIGCINIGQYGDGKTPGQDDLKDNLTKEQHSTLDSFTLNGWMFQQACKADDYTVAYSLYNKDRSDRYLSNVMVIAFVEDKTALRYYLDERINKPSAGSEICTIYKLTTTELEYSCNTDKGEKKWQLPFDLQRGIAPLN